MTNLGLTYHEGYGAQDLKGQVYLIASSTTLRHPDQFGQGAGALLEAIGRSHNTLSYQELSQHWEKLNSPFPYFYGAAYKPPVWVENDAGEPIELSFVNQQAKGCFIHAVVPCLSGEATREQEEQYREAYRHAIQMTLEKGFNSIILTPLGIGVYGWCPRRAGELVAEVLAEFLESTLSVQVPLFDAREGSHDSVFGLTLERQLSILQENHHLNKPKF